TFRQFVEQADGENNTQVYVDGAQAALYLAEKTPDQINKDPALKRLQEGIVEARASGADVAIPVADFASDIAGTDTFTQLRDYMTMSADTVAPARQEEARAETAKYVTRLLNEADENVSEYVEAQEIFTQVRDQLID